MSFFLFCSPQNLLHLANIVVFFSYFSLCTHTHTPLSPLMAQYSLWLRLPVVHFCFLSYVMCPLSYVKTLRASFPPHHTILQARTDKNEACSLNCRMLHVPCAAEATEKGCRQNVPLVLERARHLRFGIRSGDHFMPWGNHPQLFCAELPLGGSQHAFLGMSFRCARARGFSARLF